MENIHFSKWHGLGNDFILVDASQYPAFDFRSRAVPWCDRRFGIGADGLVTIRKLSAGDSDFEMRIFNSDGSEPEMCGNATRCVTAFIRQNRLSDASELCLHTRGGMVRPRLLVNGMIRVDMGEPRLKRGEIPVLGNAGEDASELSVQAGDMTFTGFAVSMGNPHFVIFVPKIEDIRLEEWGPLLENAPEFPRRTNVEFVQLLDRSSVRMRVWERGCGVTAACGTGSCATAVAGVLSRKTDRTVKVRLDGGELEIEYRLHDNHVYMTGPAAEVFRGVIAGEIETPTTGI